MRTRTRDEGRRIWLFDARERWRSLYARALGEAGFTIVATGSYAYPPSGATGKVPPPDLVILACTAVTQTEQDLVKKAARQHHQILVMAADLPIRVMRDLFLAGAYDVTTMPGRAGELVDLVKETLKEAEARPQERAFLVAGMR